MTIILNQIHYIKFLLEIVNMHIFTIINKPKAITFYCNTIERSSEKNGETMMVVRNNEMLEGLLELKEENTISKFSVKSFLKYLAYSLFLIAIIIFLFYSVYNLKDEFGANSGGPSEVFRAFYKKPICQEWYCRICPANKCWLYC